MTQMDAFWSKLWNWKSTRSVAAVTSSTKYKKIEDYRPGFPRFTALISAHAPFFLCRRFIRLRGRILLLKQDRLSVLEEKLDQVDRDEQCPLFLGMARYDRNQERLSLLTELEEKLADYDHYATNCSRMINLDAAETRDIVSLQNWVSGTGCLARDETAYLEHTKDLASLVTSKDNALLRFEILAENLVVWLYWGFRKNRHHDLSVDPNVYLYSGRLIKQVARTLLLLLITALLLLPVVICNIISATSIRIVVIMISTIAYLYILFELTRSRTMELVVAGATYATVLIVFASGSSGINS